MLFNSYIFVFLFLPLAVAGYYLLYRAGGTKAALGWLIAMSMWFYGYNSTKYLAILVASVILNYLVARLMGNVGNKAGRRVFLAVGMALDLGILFLFKYYDFFIENVNVAFRTDFGFLGLALPLGISFYTFQQLSYLIDSYKGECERYSFLEYASYVLFFPQLIAGPIVYHSELIPQLREEKNHHLCFENLSKGIYAFSLGLAKKVLIADTFSKVVTAGYDSIWDLNTISVIVTAVCYSLQIYFDFSGYCDMAYGIGFLFNVELPVNFNSPYKAASIREFWDRWHMTLTRFFTKYVYIPLGGSRKGKLRTYLNVMVVFLVSGIWHGADWTFILWGVINGLGNLFDRIFGKFCERLPRAMRILATFAFSTFAWSLFRADSLGQAKQMFQKLLWRGDGTVYHALTDVFNGTLEAEVLGRMGLGGVLDAYPAFLLMVFMLAVLLACFFMRNTQEKVGDGKYGAGRITVTIGLLTWSILSLSGVSEFLYFNF